MTPGCIENILKSSRKRKKKVENERAGERKREGGYRIKWKVE